VWFKECELVSKKIWAITPDRAIADSAEKKGSNQLVVLRITGLLNGILLSGLKV
jgi:hypothetical protein